MRQFVFAPAGKIVPAALKGPQKRGVLCSANSHEPDSVLRLRVAVPGAHDSQRANNTRKDGEDFLHVAVEIPIRTHVRIFPLSDANRALNALKNDAIRGLPFCALTMDSQREVEERRDFAWRFRPFIAGEISGQLLMYCFATVSSPNASAARAAPRER